MTASLRKDSVRECLGAALCCWFPVGASANPSEIYTAPKSWTERASPKLLHYNRLPKGCHFMAWEQPAYFTSEVRATFKSLRT